MCIYCFHIKFGFIFNKKYYKIHLFKKIIRFLYEINHVFSV